MSNIISFKENYDNIIIEYETVYILQNIGLIIPKVLKHYKEINLSYYKNNYNNIDNLVIILEYKNKNTLLNLLNKYPPKINSNSYIYFYITNKNIEPIYKNEIEKLGKIYINKFINIYNYKLNKNDKYGLIRYTNMNNEFKYDYIYIIKKDIQLILYNYYSKDANYKYNCGDNRLLQLRGTCGFNSLINGFILTKNLRILIESNIQFRIQNNLKLNKIQRFFDFIFKNMKSYDDKTNKITIELATLMKKYVYGFKTFLSDDYNGLKTSYLPLLFNIILNKLFNITNSLFTLNNYKPHNIKDKINLYLLKYNDYSNKHNPFLLMRFDNNIPTKISINKYVYELCYSYICLNGHAVCGYICNNKYYIYDSTNFNYLIDWRFNNEKNIDLNNKLPYINEYYKENMLDYKVQYVLYVCNELYVSAEHK